MEGGERGGREEREGGGEGREERDSEWRKGVTRRDKNKEDKGGGGGKLMKGQT